MICEARNSLARHRHSARWAGALLSVVGLAAFIVLPAHADESLEADGVSGGWRLYFHWRGLWPFDDFSGDLGGVVVAHTGAAVTVEPAWRARFPCEGDLTDGERQRLPSLASGALESVPARDSSIGPFPGRGSVLFQHIHDKPSPYRSLWLQIHTLGREQSAAVRDIRLSYVEPDDIGTAHPELAALVDAAETIHERLKRACNLGADVSQE